jgi:Ca2+-binding EF-hand superfamily protein
MAHKKWKKKVILGVFAATLIAAAGTVYAHHSSSSWSHHGMMSHAMDRHAGLGQALLKLDADKDGQVTMEEAENGLNKRFAAANANGDDKLTIDEFQTLWLEAMRGTMVRHFQHLDSEGKGFLTQQALQQSILSKLTDLDRNNDGVISQDELRHKRKWGRDDEDEDRDDDG